MSASVIAGAVLQVQSFRCQLLVLVPSQLFNFKSGTLQGFLAPLDVFYAGFKMLERLVYRQIILLEVFDAGFQGFDGIFKRRGLGHDIPLRHVDLARVPWIAAKWRHPAADLCLR